MEIYLVGGAVRDKLLGLDIEERDFVVVGTNEKTLLELGFNPVGKDFPVFLHPDTKEEYALARTERKTAAGHKGFLCDAGEHVTLEADLMRRDLTVNAIAEDAEGQLLDPYGGIEDLKNKMLRHVSSAFEEDPLRILRVARFLAKLPEFDVAPDTLALLQRMVDEGALAELPMERIYAELDKSLLTRAPERFFELLDSLGAGVHLWPEISPHNFSLLARVARQSTNKHFRFASLVTDLSRKQIESLCKRIKAPGHLAHPGIYTRDFYPRFLAAPKRSASDLVQDLYDLDAFRREPDFFSLCEWFHTLCNIQGDEDNSQFFRTCYEATQKVSQKNVAEDLKGPAIGEAIRRERQLAIQKLLQT